MDPGMEMNQMVIRSHDIVDWLREEVANDHEQHVRHVRTQSGTDEPQSPVGDHGMTGVDHMDVGEEQLPPEQQSYMRDSH